MILAQRATPLKWVVAPEPAPTLVTQLVADSNLPTNIVKILINRNLDTPEEISDFLNPQLSHLIDPFQLLGMKEGIDRITRAFFDN